MTIKLSSLKVDIAKEQGGDWIDYPEWPGVKFHVKSTMAAEFRAVYNRSIRTLTKKYKGKDIPLSEAQAELGRLYHKHILIGWDGLDTEFSETAALEVLTDPGYRNVFSAIEWCASQVGQADTEFVEDAAKN